MSFSFVCVLWGTLNLNADAQNRGEWRDRGPRSFGSDRGFGNERDSRSTGFDSGGGFGSSGGFGGRSMLDTNSNGTIDQEELDRMPSFVREMMQARGVELKAGMSVDEMRSSMRAGFNPERDNAGSPNGRDERSGNNSGLVRVKPVLKPYVMKPKPPLIESLPPAYAEIDINFDGQLGLDEWMLARRTDLNQFDEFDLDHDGYLIPDELKATEVGATGTNAAMSVRTEKLTIVTATPRKTSNAAKSAGKGENRENNGGSRGGDMTDHAKFYFARLDQNQDGIVDQDEFRESRRVRGMFEQAGIQPSEKMSLEEFTQALHKASESGQSNHRSE